MRMRKTNNGIGRMLIDLTPLLDVIFILLIVVVCYQSKYKDISDANIAAATAKEAAVTDEMAATKAQNTVLKAQLDTYANLNDYVNVVEIFSTYTPSDRKNRTIYISYNSEQKTINLTASNSSRAWQECESYITGILESRGDAPMVLKVMDEQMLYRDEQRIIELFGSLCEKYPNLYLRNYTESEE